MKRIFVRGISRSGGTLMATVLDAHPDVAMSYEIYPNLIEPIEPNSDGVGEYASVLEAEGATLRKLFAKLRGGTTTTANPKLRTFCYRALRAGIDLETQSRLLAEHVDDGMTLATFRERMLFLERLALEKMRREGAQHWGTKVSQVYVDLADLFPDSYYLFMLRDGRDIAASRKHVGEFDQTVEQAITSWQRAIQRFRKFSKRDGIHAHVVPYEKLATNPQPVLEDIMRFLDLPWSDQLLRHDEQNLSIFKNPTGHLSAEQVNKPISTTSIGRWKTDLTAAEISTIESIAGDDLEAHGYPLSTAS